MADEKYDLRVNNVLLHRQEPARPRDPQRQRARAAPFIEVHAAALPETLVEGELFGRDKGAYTGATEAKPGHAEAAHGGTLFLDEIGELPAAIQVKLLRFLQDRSFTRLGSTQTRRSDARIIAATNRDLTAAVKDGSFREDLYYRLAVFPMVVPPLRDRPDDVRATALSLLAARGLGADRITPPRSTSSPPITGRATSASWRTRSAARSCSPAPIRSPRPTCRPPWSAPARRARARSSTISWSPSSASTRWSAT